MAILQLSHLRLLLRLLLVLLLGAAGWETWDTPWRKQNGEAAAEDAKAVQDCNCDGPWHTIRREMWLLFNHSVDLGGLMACLAASPDACDHGPELDAPHLLLAGPEPIMHCSEEQLPLLSHRNSQACPAGMMHWMLLCALQMWLRRKYRQSALYFDHGLSFLFLALDCLVNSDWPLWPGQVLTNYRSFLEAAFPPGKLAIEQKTSDEQDSDGAPFVYETAGPVVNHSAFHWSNGPRMGLYCPPHGFAGVDGSEEDGYFGTAAAPQEAPSVLCAVPLVWPEERVAAATVLETYGPSCDELVFFLAAPDPRAAETAKTGLELLRAKAEAAGHFRTASRRAKVSVRAVDLAAQWPGMVRDTAAALAGGDGREQVSGVNQKDLLLFAHLDEEGFGSGWVCRVETDSYFAPANFRQLVAGRGLKPEEPLFLGSISYWHMHFEPRIIFNEQVQCLSRGAVRRLATVVRSAPSASQASYLRCELAPGHRGDLMLALCLAEAKITPSSDVVDRWGREFFMNYRMEDMARYMPELGIGLAARDPRSYGTDAAIHWRGKAHFFLPCLPRKELWASPFPISFHDYKDPAGIRFVHDVLTGRRTCEACPAGYRPRLAPEVVGAAAGAAGAAGAAVEL